MLTARDIMTAHPSVITPDDTVTRATLLMRDRRIGMLPVINDLVHRQLVGILTDRDILMRCFAAGHGGDCFVRDHMTADRLEWVHPDDELSAVVARMKYCQLRRMIVVDEQHGVIGIVSVPDLARRLEVPEPDFLHSVDDLLRFAHAKEE
jgi:CBS domain-containing protein